MSHKIKDCLHSADYFSIMIDETTDCSNSEQVVICCRWINSSLEAHEDFMGFVTSRVYSGISIVAGY